MMVLRTVTFRGLCNNVNLISTETFWQSSEMLMWRLVGILKWTADWLSFYWTIKTALNGTTQRGMSSAYLLNFYQLFSPFKKILCHNWLTWQGHMNITEIPNWSLSLYIFFFLKKEKLKRQSCTIGFSIQEDFLQSSTVFPQTFWDGSLTWHPTLVFVLFGQGNHVKPAIKQYTLRPKHRPRL